jgi:hypothetical protein
VTANNGDSWTGLSGSETSRPIMAQSIYNLDCTRLEGSHLRKSTTVNIIPVFQET